MKSPSKPAHMWNSKIESGAPYLKEEHLDVLIVQINVEKTENDLFTTWDM